MESSLINGEIMEGNMDIQLLLSLNMGCSARLLLLPSHPNPSFFDWKDL